MSKVSYIYHLNSLAWQQRCHLPSILWRVNISHCTSIILPSWPVCLSIHLSVCLCLSVHPIQFCGGAWWNRSTTSTKRDVDSSKSVRQMAPSLALWRLIKTSRRCLRSQLYIPLKFSGMAATVPFVLQTSTSTHVIHLLTEKSWSNVGFSSECDECARHDIW